jgi:uncharacterized protein with HEPN domain
MKPLDTAERNARLWHIRDACEALVAFAKDHSVEDYRTDAMLSAAIRWNLMIVGEAMSKLTKIDANVAPAITNVPQIIAFRNRLVHDYPATNPEDVWLIILEDIPLLLSEVSALLPS